MGAHSVSAREVGAVRVAEPVGVLAELCVGLCHAYCCSSPFLNALKASCCKAGQEITAMDLLLLKDVLSFPGECFN